MPEFTVPDFLKGQSPEEIHKDMIEQIPGDIDASEGGHCFNLTFPTAYEVAMMCNYILPQVIKMIVPMFCTDYYDMANVHGQERNIIRKEANYAEGEIYVAANEGTQIPKGSRFSTASKDGESSVVFVSVDDMVTFEESGETKIINIRAELPGKSGNVPANTIILKLSNISGITSITNPKPTINGTDEESTSDLVARIVEYDQTQGESYIGNDADYKRWAESVSGVGKANVIPATDDSGLVTVVITDLNGDPAPYSLCADVYNYIMDPTPLSVDGSEPNDQVTGYDRKPPSCNVHLLVIPPQVIEITISAKIVFRDNTSADIESLKEEFVTRLQDYIKSDSDNEIIYTQIGSMLSSCENVKDHKNLLINNQTENLNIDKNTVPVIKYENINFTV